MAAWITPTTDKAFGSFGAAEKQAIGNVIGNDSSADLLGRVVAEMRGDIRSGGFTLGADGTLPSELENDCYALFIWRFLIGASKNKGVQTEERSKANDDAKAKMKMIASREKSVEEPSAGVNPITGTSGGENPLVMRTHPVPTTPSQ